MTPISTNLRAFLNMIATSELGAELLKKTDNGYDVMVGSTPAHPLLFDNYADHPHILNNAMNSTAAGRYQLLGKYFDAYKKSLHLPDFSPESQDTIAIQQIRESHALTNVEIGNFDIAVGQCNHIWASLPGSPYGQHTNKLDDLRQIYLNSGGKIGSA